MLGAKRNSNRWQDALRLLSRCPVCNTDYNQAGARTLGRVEQARLVHLVCQQCSSFFVALLVVMGQGLSSMGMVTDLSFADLKRLQGAPALTADDLIAGYQQLQQPDFAAAVIAAPA